MNSEIKFRAWDKTEKMMCYVSLIDFENSTCVLIYPTKTYKEEDKSFSEVKLMQYTGLKDKNGKEIYKGDILKTPRGIGRVFLRLGCWFVENQEELGYFPQFELEVIGNVYENPKLLERIIK